MFANRTQAGQLLTQKIFSSEKELGRGFKPFDIVLAIPRGGVVVGRVIADELNLPLGVVNAKKIPTPGQPELAAGARVVADRGFGKTPEVRGKRVILTDDGIATGETVKAAIKYLKKKGAAKIMLAVPVAPPDTVVELAFLVDKIVVLETPSHFFAVGQAYQDFPQVSDREVLQLLKK